MSKCSKKISGELFAVSLTLYPPWGHEPQREGRQTDSGNFDTSKARKGQFPPSQPSCAPSPADSAMTLETPAFRCISHQHFHQQASFLQRSSQLQLCSEGRTRSPGSSSESVTGVLCSYFAQLSQRILQWVMCEVCVIVCCVEVTHSTLEPTVVPMPSGYMCNRTMTH